ncbi:AEC family transporter [Ammoniphilus resinae]|uniref:Permease n=1 Tax=Ammoniphilus resinae TaxID=861532 RepID=A0ABS4GN79_9BACL|nr:AEC family transporter [Ammoniphilus resinae]MBP1931725.1 putative permease [Ammoniphilus resinae]
MLFLTILEQIILPILILIGIGMIVNRFFQLDMKTLSKLLMYIFIPAIAFIKIYETKISLVLLASIMGFLILQLIIVSLIGMGVSRLMHFGKSMKASFQNSIILSNNGNIGLPLNDLVFRHDPYAMSIQIVVVVFEILVTFTLGLFNAGAAKEGLKNSLLTLVKMPILYTLFLAFCLNFGEIKIPDSIMVPIRTTANGMISIALITIGAQVAVTVFNKNSLAVFVSTFIRLLIAPVIAFFLILLFGLEGITAQALLIASAMPTSRNSASLALEFDNEPEFAAQAVLLSTLLSAVTMTLVIYLSKLLF